MHLSAALSCLQYCSDVPPDESWVLKPLDRQNYLEKVLERFKSFELFDSIYLLVGEDPKYASYLQYSDGPVKVVQMKTSDFIHNPRYEPGNWNMLHNAMVDLAHAWAYQIMLGFEEEFLYSDIITHGFVSRTAILEAWNKIQNQPDTYCGIRGLFGHSGTLLSKNILERKYAKKLHGKPRNDIFVEEDRPIRVVDDNLDKLLGFETIRYFGVTLNRKENFQFMQNFYRDIKVPKESEFREKFLAYCKENHKQYTASNPSVIRISPLCSEQNNASQELPLELAEMIFSQAASVGKLNVVLDASTVRHSRLQDLIQLMKVYNLFYVLETDGSYDESLNQDLSDHFNIIIFVLDEISVEALNVARPEIDASTVFMNLTSQMMMSQSRGLPQVGIYCQLPREDKRAKEIISFWKDRQDYIPGISIYKVQGHLTPTVQFVRYSSANQSVESFDQGAKDREIHLNSAGQFDDGSSITDVSLLSYYAAK